jgi:hypothetical protein
MARFMYELNREKNCEIAFPILLAVTRRQIFALCRRGKSVP